MKKKQIKKLATKILLTAALVGVGIGIRPFIDPPGGRPNIAFNEYTKSYCIDPPGGGCATMGARFFIDPPGGMFCSLNFYQMKK